MTESQYLNNSLTASIYKELAMVTPTSGEAKSEVWRNGFLGGAGGVVGIFILKYLIEKGSKFYFSTKQNTIDSQITDAILAKLWIGCCGIITSRQYGNYVNAVSLIVNQLIINETPLRTQWDQLNNPDRNRIKLQIAETAERILVGDAYRLCRFFKSFCKTEVSSENIEDRANAIADAVTPHLRLV